LAGLRPGLPHTRVAGSLASQAAVGGNGVRVGHCRLTERCDMSEQSAPTRVRAGLWQPTK